MAQFPKERFGAESLERPALVHTPAGRWRLSCAAPGDGARTWALYDGRATAEENFEERTGLAVAEEGRFTAVGDAPLLPSPHPPHGLRYADVVALPEGGARWFYEATRPDGAHELRTVLLPA